MKYMIIMKIFNIFWIRTLNPQLKQEKIFIRQINRMLPRRRVVLKQLTNLKSKWRERGSYGSRWMAETVFSSLKRMFGEHVCAKKFPNMVKEMMLKASLYNLFLVEE